MRSPILLTSVVYTWLALTLQLASADIVVENDLINPEEIFDFIVLQDSNHWWLSPNTTQYFCVMRGLWNPYNHPKKFPNLARVSNPLIYTSSKQYLPWLINRATTWGVEKIAETGFTDTFKVEARAAGRMVNDLQEGKGFFVDQEDPEKNYAYLPGIKVTPDYPFLSGIAGLMPTPDWFTGFYLLDVIDEYDRTFWNRILIHTYPWDSGTDAGDTYMSVDQDLDPPRNVERITPKNAPNGIFLSPDGRTVPPVAEWDCVLHVCEEGEDDCQPDNWPPENGCDMLKYPGCELECDPEFDEVCEECKPKPKLIKLGAAPDENENGRTFYRSCCQSNHEPLNGMCTPGWRSPSKGGTGADDEGTSKKDGRSFWRPFRSGSGAASNLSTSSLVSTMVLMGMGLFALIY
eukprot:CAMPEP_0198148804 /NCGR_PEP_ID=MMETSP1443-20131203/43407_1 /TAXON_ID=186043 /ORGANISM="Entomoneis sp., Strain CCMP2396" /LENGTH=403 /DNA_ID=CAMNT_0043813619 /DNA_START=50 /DNA_END=1261 /DNA_ORIENTATION=-